ncbi:MAG: hypothetical protein ABJC12_09440 [Saprospiraceae bacterium]
MLNLKCTLAIFLNTFVIGFAVANNLLAILDVHPNSKNPFGKDSLYRDIPKCPSPFQVDFSMSSDTSIRIFINDVSAKPNELAYEVRYKKAKGMSWKTEYIVNGNQYSLGGLHPFEKYIFQ